MYPLTFAFALSYISAAAATEALRAKSSPCVASQGYDRSYSHPVNDSKACTCSEWHPKGGPCSKHHVIPNAPWGLLFFGMSLSRLSPNIPTANIASVTHQDVFDFNRLQDRANQFLCKTSDDGWLCGGGNAPGSFLLPHIDSAHMELVHPGTTCANVATTSVAQPDLSSYYRTPSLVTGAPLDVLVERTRSHIAFDSIRVTPTEGRFTPSDEYQLRFHAENNPKMTFVYNRLVEEFIDIQVLDKSDPFHMSMCRETKFCSNTSRQQFFDSNEKLTIQPWKQWAGRDGGVVLNEGLEQYRGRAGGFYLFVTRNRPLIYFAPKPKGEQDSGSDAYFCEWRQDGRVVAFANPFGGPVEETLVSIPSDVPVANFIDQNPSLKAIVDGLCKGFSFQPLPTSTWTPPGMEDLILA